MKKVFVLTATILIASSLRAIGQQPDTIVVELAPSSKMVLTIGDPDDVDQLRTFDFQALMNDILDHLDDADLTDTLEVPEAETNEKDIEEPSLSHTTQREPFEDREDKRDDFWSHRHSRTRHAINFDFGINNFLEDGRFPDDNGAQYTVRPWGSWYVGINSIQTTNISRNFYIEWGFGVSWYNFKFQDDNTLITKTDDGVVFSEDPRSLSFKVSKLSATYLNASFIPMFDSGKNHRNRRFWSSHNNSFRIGVGPYVGYRLESHTKQVFNIDGEKEFDKERDNFYLNNLRYGARLQLGFDDVDFFVSYDLNELFVSDKGPKVNAITFGFVF